MNQTIGSIVALENKPPTRHVTVERVVDYDDPKNAVIRLTLPNPDLSLFEQIKYELIANGKEIPADKWHYEQRGGKTTLSVTF